MTGKGKAITAIYFEPFEPPPNGLVADAETRWADYVHVPGYNWGDKDAYSTPSASIAINTKGSWNKGWGGSRNVFGNYSDEQFRAMLILHELGHAYNQVAGLGGFKVVDHVDFDKEILANCFQN